MEGHHWPPAGQVRQMGEMPMEGDRVWKPSRGGLDLLWHPLGDFLFQGFKAWVRLGDWLGPSGSCDARRVQDPHDGREWVPSVPWGRLRTRS